MITPTNKALIVGSPNMSSEQAEMSCLDVDTRSDVYSLGVLLYELLTGATPLETDRLRSAGYVEMLRMIREEEPPKPSTRLSSSADWLTVIAKRRSVSPVQLQKAVRGDVDWIVMKALEKDRGRRYATPDALATDIERHLSDTPVDARPPSKRYRAFKFLRRNRTLVSATLALAAVLLAASLIASLGWITATRNEGSLRNTLVQLQRQVIERALLLAMAGELHSEHPVMEEAELAKVPPDWMLTLEGVGYLHRGENEKALGKLQEAIEVNRNNVSRRRCYVLLFSTADAGTNG